MIKVRMQQVAVKLITWPTLAASGSRGLHVACDMADQINGKGVGQQWYLKQHHTWIRGLKGMVWGGPCYPLPPSPPLPPPHTHKLICLMYFRHNEAIACKTTNRSIYVNSRYRQPSTAQWNKAAKSADFATFLHSQIPSVKTNMKKKYIEIKIVMCSFKWHDYFSCVFR